jgi:GNAT superfamily N-acetyltransferase
MEQIVSFHKEALPYSVNSQAGQNHLLKLYSDFHVSPGIFGYVACESDKVLGVILCAADFNSLSSTTASAKRYLLVRLLSPLFAIRNLKNVFDHVLINRSIKKIKPTPHYIMVWFVKKGKTNKGFGSLLIERLLEELSARKANSVVVDVRKGSETAIRGYERKGFTEFKSTPFSKVLMREI